MILIYLDVQYIQQQNELIKSLRESMKNYEENLDDGIPKEREVSHPENLMRLDCKLTKSPA